MLKKSQILKELKQHLQSYRNNFVSNVILFGSQASGNIKTNSDFDILIVLENDFSKEDENIILDLCYDIDLKYNIVIDAHIISKNGINSVRGKQSIYQNVINHGVYA